MRILIISEYIAPVRAIASLRWTKLGKYLNETCGCEVDLLTNKKSFDGSVVAAQQYEYDATIAPDLEHFSRIFEMPDTPSSKALMKLIARLKAPRAQASTERASSVGVDAKGADATAFQAQARAKSANSAFVDKLYEAYANYIERCRVRSLAKMSIKIEDYDAVISTYSPKWTHRAAEALKRRHPDMLWIADYRDAPKDSDARDTTANRAFAKEHTGTADMILGVSEAVIDRLGLDADQRRAVIPHGYDAADLNRRERKPSDTFILSYTGTLYHDSNYLSDLTPAFEALQSSIDAGTVDPGDVLVVYCGGSSVEFRAQASAYPSVPIEDRGFVTREEAMALQDESSMLIYTTCNNDVYESGLTGKTYEYLSSGVPVLALCSGDKPDAATSLFFRKAKAGLAYEEARRERDLPLLRGYIESEYDEWKKIGMTSTDTEWLYIEMNDYAKLARELQVLIEGLRSESSIGRKH